jgi:hypothetical protein
MKLIIYLQLQMFSDVNEHWNKRISILISLLSVIVHFDVEPEWLGDEANDNDHNNGKEEVMDVHGI